MQSLLQQSVKINLLQLRSCLIANKILQMKNQKSQAPIHLILELKDLMKISSLAEQSCLNNQKILKFDPIVHKNQ